MRRSVIASAMRAETGPAVWAAAGALALGASGCATTSAFQDGGPGRAYLVETHHYVLGARTRVWSCDATTGSPQCWRVVEKE